MFGDDDPEDAYDAGDTVAELLANLEARIRWLGDHLDELDDAHFHAWINRFRAHLAYIRGRVT